MVRQWFFENKLVITFSCVALIAVIAFRNTPMFWDMAYVSQVANHIVNSRFDSVFPSCDNGSPPLYSVYFALLWTVFGKSLLVSHIAVWPFVVLLLYQFQQLLKQYVNKAYHAAAFLILFAEPVFSTQVIFSGYDIVMVSLFLLAINSILKSKLFLLEVAVILIPLLSPRGFSLVIGIYIVDLFVNLKAPVSFANLFRRTIPYMISLAIFLLWLLFHWSQTGWLLVSEENKYILSHGNLEWFMRNISYIIWKIIDSGRIILYLFMLLIFIKYRRAKIPFHSGIIVFVMMSGMLVYISFFATIHSLVAQRHFLFLYVISIVFFASILHVLKQRLAQMIVMIVVISLLMGNLWTYPERYGNAWDSSLKSLPYFALENDLYEYLNKQEIDPDSVGAQFPMNFNRKYTHLESESYCFRDIDSRPLNEFDYVVQSNISNSFDIETKSLLEKKWILLMQFSGPIIYIRLYKNPNQKS